MRQRIRSHLTYANVMATIAVFLVLSGGTAVALSGTNTVQSDDLGPGAQVKAPDVATGAVGSAAVTNESLTGQDVKNQSGVDTCISFSVRLGPLCAGAANTPQTWSAARALCANLDLRLPTLGEAQALATKHDIPNVDGTEYFWTDEYFMTPSGQTAAWIVNDNGGTSNLLTTSAVETACVTTPTN
jgi:hypothetical protein